MFGEPTIAVSYGMHVCSEWITHPDLLGPFSDEELVRTKHPMNLWTGQDRSAWQQGMLQCKDLRFLVAAAIIHPLQLICECDTLNIA